MAALAASFVLHVRILAKTDVPFFLFLFLATSQENVEWSWLEIELYVCSVPSVLEPILLTAAIFSSMPPLIFGVRGMND